MTKVLIVDDNRMDRRLAGACVEEVGMSAVYADNGRSALNSLESESPDIVLTDLDMPEMNGLELVRELQKRDPTLPVILMTAKGSEAVAAEALAAGASSYVPKSNFQQELNSALKIVNDSSQSRQQRQQVYQYMVKSETEFVLGNDHNATAALVGYFQEAMRLVNLCPEGELVRIGTALSEAIVNAIDHGNLELDSAMREDEDGDKYYKLGDHRRTQEPYSKRRVFVTCRVTESEALFTIRDEGPGFDPTTLPDPTDPENLMRPHGRGLMLIRTFMDRVSFSKDGNEIRMHKHVRRHAAR